MKSCFLGKNKKNIIVLSAELVSPENGKVKTLSALWANSADD